MRRRSLSARLWIAVACVALLGAGESNAKDAPCAVVELAPPPPVFGIDVDVLKSEANVEAQRVHDELKRDRRRVVISLALSEAELVVCHVNATVRDARTGTVLAVIERNTRASGPISQERRKQLAHASVRNVVRSVPDALRMK